ncbi:hypothetical protein [Caballeronia sp. ATUFL_M2_KS44]|uniref:hypothetical protein n=1 Tax=Caballeronia sp. ATUFL_M2_KS44 TaxID=2921767 RepID=UPI002027C1FA|nr:hypothetical protein [Caballeronia sp. ATUFL_M2_KS44]
MDALTCREPGAMMLDGATLVDLWHRRTALTDIEIGQMYELVRHALRSYYPAELRALPDDKEELVAQFIFSRVLRFDLEQRASAASPESAPSTVYALCAYFRRFLIDCLRSAGLQRNLSMEIEGVQTEVERSAHAPADSIEASLAEHNLSEARVRMLARAFVASLNAHDRIVLAGSLGSIRERGGGLRGVADAYDVPSYHYRARKLGVTMKKSATPEDFAGTLIGHWIAGTLRIEISEDNRAAILVVLSLLAMESHA